MYIVVMMDNNKNWAAFYRGGAISATMWPLPAKGAVWMNGKGAPAIDRAACDTYLKSRIQLRDKLLADIRVELNKRSKSILGVV